MASIDIKVLTEILNSGTLAHAVKLDLKSNHFKDPEAKQIYSFMRRHYYALETRGGLPLIEDIKKRWPSFETLHLTKAEAGNLKTLVRHLKLAALGSDFHATLRYLQDMADGEEESPDVLSALAYEKFQQLRQDYAEGAKPLGISDIRQHVEDSYEGALTGAAYGIPWPWECLTADTLGKKPEDFIVFYGRMKSMKTWLLLYCAALDYLKYNQRVMIWSREMSERQIQLRLGSILAGVDYQLLKKGKLPPRVKRRAFNKLKELEDMWRRQSATIKEEANRAHRDIFILCGRDAPKTIESLDAKVDEYKPDILYVDSFYHLGSMRADKAKQDHIRLQYLSEDMKQLAIDRTIPVVAAAQANREGEKALGRSLIEVAGSDAIAREADLMIRVIMRRGRELSEAEYEGAEDEKGPKVRFTIKGPVKRIRDEVAEEQKKGKGAPKRISAEIAMVLPGNREGVLDAFTITAIPGYNFEVSRTDFSSESIQEWVQKDNEEVEREVAKERNRRRKSARHEEDRPVQGSFNKFTTKARQETT